MNNVLDIMHKKKLSMTLFVDEHGREQKRTALEWVSFVKNIIHVNKIVVIERLNSKIKGQFYNPRIGHFESAGRVIRKVFDHG